MADNLAAPIASGTSLATKQLSDSSHASKVHPVDATGTYVDLASSGTAFAITPGTATITTTRGIYVGVAGDVAATINGVDLTFKNAIAGTILPVKATRVLATGTTATNLIGLV